MIKGLQMTTNGNVIDFESAKKAYLVKLNKKANSEVKPEKATRKKKEDPFDWDRIRNIKVKVVCRDKH